MKTFLLTLILAASGCQASKNDLMRDYRDQGVIGEPKTRVEKPTSGIIISKESESLMTPFVVGDEALFGNEFGNSFRLRYAFRFACLDWRYRIWGYLVNLGEPERRSSVVDLESPDKKTRVKVELLDVALSPGFMYPLTEQQIQQQRDAQSKRDADYARTQAGGIIIASRYTCPYPDPLSSEERIRAGKEVISRLLDRGVDGYRVVEGSQISFSPEEISGKEFVRAEAELFSGGQKKKCVVWALNVSGYRLKTKPDERRANTWLCIVTSDAADFSNMAIKARRIPETLRFAASDQNVYPDLRD